MVPEKYRVILMANIFISYRSKDEKKALRLAKDIEAAGHIVWFDKWKIDPGDSIVGKINDGLKQANYFFLCFSSSGIHSEWLGREWMSSLAREIEGTGIKIIPIVLTGGGPPPILADKKYVDLTKNWAAGISELLRAVL